MALLERLLELNTTYLLMGLFVLIFSLEQILETQFSFNKKTKHALNNILFQGTMFVCNIFWAVVIVSAIEWLHQHEVGLFYQLPVPLWMNIVLGVLFYDMSAYWFHRMSHRVPLLWRFHRVHHSDTAMDASTNFRAHPIEILIWFGLSDFLATALFGMSELALGLYALILIPFFIFQHANLRFPAWLDSSLGFFITTPNLHKLHHDQDQLYTDSNYADIFILWDRLFGTFRHKPVEEVNPGLKEFNEPGKQTFWYLMVSPFFSIERKGSN